MREENTTLLIANFVVDASCCSNLWQNPGRVLNWLWSAHDFASGSRSHMHFALSIPSKELALEFSDAFYDATVGDGCRSRAGIRAGLFFPWCLTKAFVAPVHRPCWLYALGRFMGLMVDSGDCVARSSHL